MSRKMTFFEFWRSQERGEVLRRAERLRLHPSQLKQLLSNGEVRAKLQNARMASLLPPVGTEVFRCFTPTSLDEIQQHHEAARDQKKKPEKEGVKHDLPKAATHLEAGKPLPFVYGDPPPELLNIPLEDLDPFYQSKKTFIVLSKGNIIHRFNAGSACYLLSPFSLVRTTSIRILTHSLFRLLILLTLLTNCAFMMIRDPPAWKGLADYIFMSVYIFEVVVKILSRGFCFGRFTFLRDPWNWLDALVIIMLPTEFIHLGKVSVLSTISRVLKIISVNPGMKTTAGAFVQSLKRLVGIVIVMLFVLSVLAVIGQMFFMESMRNQCVHEDWHYMNRSYGSFNDSYDEFITRPEHFSFLHDETDPVLCGNRSDARRCPKGFICLRTNVNPDNGYTNYDTFGWSLLAVFRLMTQDSLESLFKQMSLTEGRTIVLLFMSFIFPTFFCIVSLFMVVLARTSTEQERAKVREAKQREEEFTQILEVIKRKEDKEEQTTCRVVLTKDEDSAPQKKKQDLEQPGIGEPEEKQKLCSPCCLFFLKWNCCSCWRRLKQLLHASVTNPFFDFVIVVCLIINIVIMSMEHFPMTMEFEEMLSITRLVFTGIFMVEMLLKIMALDPYGYFQGSWNIFESIIVVISLLDLMLADFESVPVLRIFPLMRVLRLGRWWPSLHMFMKIVWSSVSALRNLSLVLLVMFFTFIVAGMQLFKEDYELNVCRISSDCLTRWHMSDFPHTFVLVFRILYGQWIETLWDCMDVSSRGVCLVFHMTVLVIGHLLVLNLFLALSLNSISVDSLGAPNNLQIAVNQIKAWIRACIRSNPDHKVVNGTKDNGKEYLGLTSVTSESVSEVKDLGGNHDNLTAENEDETKQQQNEDIDNVPPEDCCCCNKSQGKVWFILWKTCFCIVRHRYFENFIIFIILLSSAALVFEDIYLQHRQILMMVVDVADQVFTYLFLLEMFLKWIAFGFKKYFTSIWCWIDFLVLVASLVSTSLGMLGYVELGGGLSVRSLRALRPLRILSRFKGLRVALDTLVATLPSLIDWLLVSAVIWLMFSITGVNLFAGRFYHCYNKTSHAIFQHEIVSNQTECLQLIDMNYTEVRWKNTKLHYDNVWAGYQSLLHVVSLTGHLSTTSSATDMTEMLYQPTFDNNIFIYWFFVVFIVFGCFFSFTFFIRALIDTLGRLRHKFGGKHVFMTEEQQKCRTAVKNLFSRKPVPRPQRQCQARLFDLVTSPWYDIAKVVLVCLNLVVLMMENIVYDEILNWSQLILIMIFLIEFVLKIIALGKHYISDWLNVLDSVILLISIVGLFLTDLIEYFFSSSLFCIFRLLWIGRVVHYCRWTRGIRKLFLAFGMSLPALFNICLLYFILIFIFSVFGGSSFAYVKKDFMINDVLNFETFINSMMILFIINFKEWDGLSPILDSPPDCEPDMENPGTTITGNCGRPVMGMIFICSYISLSFLLVVHLYITVILEAFSLDDGEHLSDRDLRMFHKTWKKFNPDASKVMKYSELPDFCNALRDPLRIPKPNTVKLVNMDLPLLPGDKIHCVDILLALSTQAFGDLGEKDVLKARLEKMFRSKTSSEVTSEPISSTLRRKREEVAAAVIQRAYRKHFLKDGGATETKQAADV